MLNVCIFSLINFSHGCFNECKHLQTLKYRLGLSQIIRVFMSIKTLCVCVSVCACRHSNMNCCCCCIFYLFHAIFVIITYWNAINNSFKKVIEINWTNLSLWNYVTLNDSNQRNKQNAIEILIKAHEYSTNGNHLTWYNIMESYICLRKIPLTTEFTYFPWLCCLNVCINN